MSYSDEFIQAVKEEIQRTHPGAKATVANAPLFLDVITGDAYKLWEESHTELAKKVLDSSYEALNKCENICIRENRLSQKIDEKESYLEATVKNLDTRIDTLSQLKEDIGNGNGILEITYLYKELVNIASSANADPNVCVRESAYIVWAFLTGGKTNMECIHESNELLACPEQKQQEKADWNKKKKYY